MTTSLDQYGSAEGLAAWSLDEEIIEAPEEILEKMLNRARAILRVYGPYNQAIDGFETLATELVYYTAEAMYVFGGLVQSIVSPMRAERMGSYSYDKGDRKTAHKVIEDHDVIWPLIMHLRSNSDPIRYGTRVEYQATANPLTGIRDAVIHAYSNRRARALKRMGLVSDTDEWDRLVYGDHGVWWPR